MPITVLYNDTAADIDDAEPDGAALWLTLDDLTRASGWQLKPEGACLGDVCVPLPAGRRDGFVRGEAGAMRFDLAALARLLDMPSLYDATTRTWCFVDGAAARSQRMASLEAPDFTLPDLGGAPHSLVDYRGQKVLMVAWASW